MRRIFAWFGYPVGYILLCLVGFYIWANHSVNKRLAKVYDVPPVEFGIAQPDLALGERIVHIRNGCVECHGKDLGGANVINDPAFAVIHGPNITPRKLSGWSDGEVARAIRDGIGRTGTPLLLMPSHEYSQLSHLDLISIVGYLRTVKSVKRDNLPVRLGPIAYRSY